MTKKGRPKKKDRILTNTEFIGTNVPVQDAEFIQLYKIAKNITRTEVIKRAIYEWRISKMETRNSLIKEIIAMRQREWDIEKFAMQKNNIKEKELRNGLVEFRKEKYNVLSKQGLDEDICAVIVNEIKF